MRGTVLCFFTSSASTHFLTGGMYVSACVFLEDGLKNTRTAFAATTLTVSVAVSPGWYLEETGQVAEQWQAEPACQPRDSPEAESGSLVAIPIINGYHRLSGTYIKQLTCPIEQRVK